MLKISTENIALMFLGVLALGRAIYVVKDECPPDEEYLICGPACPGNCTNLTSSCVDDCVEGCFCSVGLVRDENGTCVSPDKCPTVPTCSEDQEFMECGPACPPSCSSTEDQLCTLQCVTGCFCKPPLLLDDAGNCVAAKDCPAEPCLNENEVYDSCRGACDPSCSDPMPMCNKICVGGCICSAGFLRNESGVCVSVEKCPGNGTDVTLLKEYVTALNNILHL